MADRFVDGSMSRDRTDQRDRWRAATDNLRSLDLARSSAIIRHRIDDIPLFAGLGTDCLDGLQRIALRRSFVNGQIIYLQDDDADFLNVVAAGHVRLSHVMEDGSAVLHDVLSRNGVFGEFSVLDGPAYPDMATAVGRVSLVSFPAVALFDLASMQPALALALRGAVASRYRAYITLVRDLSLQSLSARLARTLLRVADRIGRWVEQDGRRAQAVGAVITQTDLGLMARGSRGNVNRTLQAWQRAGWIALKERSVVILDRGSLTSLATKDQD